MKQFIKKLLKLDIKKCAHPKNYFLVIALPSILETGAFGG
ncbi:MAG: hypothetical protein JWO44_1091 [Bacteroidetes bacterium]|nr:hypothetical protein [Bacteroidota bacterium]